MTDHLAAARQAVTSATHAPDAGTTLSWLTMTCERILDHLDAQQAAQEVTSAPQTAPQAV